MRIQAPAQSEKVNAMNCVYTVNQKAIMWFYVKINGNSEKYHADVWFLYYRKLDSAKDV